MIPPSVFPSRDLSQIWLRRFSKLTCFSTLFLIFVGGMVTSTGSGLAVPDWPLSYGSFFPPMVGGVFYEHGHRIVAATVGFLMLCLAIWLGFKEKRRWVRTLGYAALGAVVLQGILGGMTVLFLLPTPVSVSHGILAQTFFVLTVIIAYSQSKERNRREYKRNGTNLKFLKIALVFFSLVYIQLILGALMRHTGSGLAIPDFPQMGGYWLPPFNEVMLNNINHWRFDNNLDPVSRGQIFIHFIHRLGAVIIVLIACLLNFLGLRWCKERTRVIETIYLIDFFVAAQLMLGIFTVLTRKAPILASVHVMTGAALLGLSVLLFLRIAPLSIKGFKQAYLQ